MKLTDFTKSMVKPIFRWEEARLVARQTSPSLLKLQLHQWAKRGEIIRIRRGVYCFPNRIQDKVEIAKALYEPAYISLEYALHAHGLLPDVVFAVTLLTPRTSRNFKTPFGQFIYHKIKGAFFWGYDPETLMAEKEKALVDYFYLYRAQLTTTSDCWKGLRWQNLGSINFTKARHYSQKTGLKKVENLIRSLELFRRKHGKT